MHRRTRRAERLLIKLLIGGLVLGVVGFVAFKLGARGYQHWQEVRFCRRANQSLAAGELMPAALNARYVLQLNDANAEAWRIMAEVAERNGDRSAVSCRSKVASLQPDSIDATVALAQTALRFNEIAVAEKALARPIPGANQSATYRATQGQFALAKKDSAKAEAEFVEATRLDPANGIFRLNLAAVQLQSDAADHREAGATTLRTLLDNEKLRAPAARLLRDDAARRRDAKTLLEVSQQLKTFPDADFRDRISYVQVLRAMNRPDFGTALSELENEAATDERKAEQLLLWMGADRLALFAISWVKELPAEITSKRNVQVAVAECYVAANDWAGLEKWCGKEWGELEFLRQAFLARAARGRGEEAEAQLRWSKAVQMAQNDGNRLYTLADGAAKWGWRHEAEDLLWTLGNDPQKQAAALGSLYEYYAQQGATADLYRVVARFCESRPQDERAQNNLAQLSLLLNLNPAHAHDIAEHLYKDHPKDPVYVSTYALSLYRRGRYRDAVNAMRELGTTNLAEPGTAAYYGVFLVAAGETGSAVDYIDRGFQARLLPEERSLLEGARAKAGGPARQP